MRLILFLVSRCIKYHKHLVGVVLLNSIIIAMSATLGIGLAEEKLRYAGFQFSPEFRNVLFEYGSTKMPETEQALLFEVWPVLIEKNNISTTGTLLVVSEGNVSFKYSSWLNDDLLKKNTVTVSGDIIARLGQHIQPGDSILVAFENDYKTISLVVENVGPWMALPSIKEPIIIIFKDTLTSFLKEKNMMLQQLPPPNYFRWIFGHQSDSFWLFPLPHHIFSGFYLAVYNICMLLYAITAGTFSAKIGILVMRQTKRLVLQGITYSELVAIILFINLFYSFSVSIIGARLYELILSFLWNTPQIPILLKYLFLPYAFVNISISMAVCGVLSMKILFGITERFA